ncbi:cupin domain-containing protein [Pseudonocardia kujensis]|uniref:cupin domain-containing protein n=1 Tax=Pseudonocardia kujensis TaxID=1128675 RepID=UPI001E542FD3|nr:cupin domain-containing protein [Pseudonocardia kujensis]MCE0765788.1 cupin domain-containing protein [Pseudonocardia kujensis]
MYVARRRLEGSASTARTDTFTGAVWADPVVPTTDGTTINDVFFSPRARTFWHHHEHGQLLIVLSGSGFVCPDGAEPARIEPGDVVWVPPGERHWHGAALDSYLLHRAVSLGATAWAEAVVDADYAAVVGG